MIDFSQVSDSPEAAAKELLRVCSDWGTLLHA
jgi:hypothetical protein